MTRIAFSINEIGRVLAGEQTLFIRPAQSSLAMLELGARLWVAEPYHLEHRFRDKAPTVALSLGAQPAFAADHVYDAPALARTHGQRLPARSLCRDWHRAHVIVRSRTELRLQDLTAADLANLGHRSASSFARIWDAEINVWRRGMKWANNPAILRFGFELVRQPIAPEALAVLPRNRPQAPLPPPAVEVMPDDDKVVAADTGATVSLEAAQAFADRHRQVRKLSATAINPLDLAPGPVRVVAARPGQPPRLPTLAERETGLCCRCGSRLAFGCEHHPRQETAA